MPNKESGREVGESRPWLVGGAAGLLAAGVTVGVATLLTAVGGSPVWPVVALGNAFIDLTPAWLRTLAISAFGSSDKLALVIGMLAVIALLAAVIGILARRRVTAALAGVAVLGGAGAAAVASRPGAGPEDVLSPIMGAIVGGCVLVLLTRAALTPATRVTGRTRSAASMSRETGPPGEPSGAVEYAARDAAPDRRRFLAFGAGAAILAAGGNVGGRLFSRIRAHVAESRAAIRLPAPASAAAPVPAGADLDIPNTVPFFTPNSRVYRVDTALTVPQVATYDWRLRVHGMVERSLELTFDDLLSMPLIERDITLTCVSNEVGGYLASNVRWLGVPLAGLLREAGVRRGADQLLSRSADGWTCGTPTATVMDGRDAMLAIAMNGEPLPLEHGFPARMVVPGLYGYVSATKWVVDLELTRFADATAYWALRGWAERAPIKTMSRIDTPPPRKNVQAGRVAVAGVAWAQHQGIDRVEVRVDGGPWQQARLAPVPSEDTWRQWVYAWDATPGRHRLQARATDGTGKTQTGERVPKLPDGASGWHTRDVTVV